jgi:hypothetical protein
VGILSLCTDIDANPAEELLFLVCTERDTRERGISDAAPALDLGAALDMVVVIVETEASKVAGLFEAVAIPPVVIWVYELKF